MKINFSLKNLKNTKKFSRQAIVQDFLSTQIKLLSTKILIIGGGGLGCPVSLYLSKTGAETKIIDFDKIEIHNLPRQVLFDESEIEKNKSEIIAKKLKIISQNVKISIENVYEIIREYDFIVDCTDSMNTRYILNDACKFLGKNFLCASVLGWEGQIYTFKKDGACYRCMYEKPRDVVSNCAESGVVNTMCGVIGTMLATEVLKKIDNEDYENYMYYDGKNNELIKMKMRNTNKNCSACLKQATKLFNSSCTAFNYDVEEIESEKVNEKDFIILDVRKKVVFDLFNIENSINIPLNDLIEMSDGLLKQKFNENKVIAVLCYKGWSAKRAAKFLIENNYKAVTIKGGMDAIIDKIEKEK